MKFLKDESGVAVTEFVLVLPILLLIVCFTIIAGLMIYTKTLMVVAASEAATYGSYSIVDDNIPISEVYEKVEDHAYSVLQHDILISNTTVIVSSDEEFIKVEVESSFNVVFPLVEVIFEDSVVQLNEHAIAKIQRRKD